MSESWKVNGTIFFELFLSDLDEKMTSAGYKRQKMTLCNSSRTLFKNVTRKRKYRLPLIISALVASNWSQITFFILAKILTSISEFSPNKHCSATRRHLAIVETSLKSWKRRTAENYSRSIVMLLTWNRLHFTWCYWLPKILLLPYTCDGIIGCCSNSIHKK